MKIKSVHIDGFGKWVDQDFDFSANPQVIVGANEAGKTTLAVFIRSVLFGFANAKGKNRYQQYTPRASASYGGSLLVEDHGQEYRIKRTHGRSGGKVTITDQAGHQFGAAKLTDLLGNVDQETYQAVFGFSLADLQAVDSVNKTAVQQHLQQVGAVGSNEWRQLISQLDKSADNIFKPRGRKPVLNRHLKEYQDMQSKVQAAREKYEDYQQLRAGQQEEEERVHHLQYRLKELQPRLERLEQLGRLWPVYDNWRQGQQAKHRQQMSDADVNRAERLRAQEQELQRQVSASKSQLDSLKGRADQFDQSALTDYHAHRTNYQQLQDSLLQLRAQEDHQRQQEKLLEQRFAERNQLQDRYGHQLPAPLSEREVVELENLLKDTRQQPASNQRLSLGLAGLAAVLVVLGLIGRWGSIIAMGLVVLAGSGYWYYRQQRDQQRTDQHRHTRIVRFGHAHGLTNFPTEQWLSMQADLHRAADLNQELSSAQASTDRYQQELKAVQDRLPKQVVGNTPGELAQSFADWLNHQADQWQEWTTIKQQLTVSQDQLSALKKQLHKVQAEKQALYQTVGANSDTSFDDFLQNRANAHRKQAATSAYGQQLTDQDKADLAHFGNEDKLRGQLSKVRNQVVADRLDLQHAQEKQQHNRLVADNLAADGTLAELEQRQANLTAQIWQEAQKWISDQLAIQWIDRALVLSSAKRYPAIISAANHFFATLTNGHYEKIILDNDGVHALTTNQEEFVVDELSTGTAEQLYVALRLGFASVMSDRLSLPIVIDDGFVNFDHVRRDHVMAILDQLADHNQVLYFTTEVPAGKHNILDLNHLDHE